jgi:hypothetical protein
MAPILFDWLIWRPAGLVASLACLPIALSPVAAAMAAWFYLVRLYDERSDGRTERWSTFILVGAAAVYIFFVVGVAVLRLPAILAHIQNSN